MTSKAKRLLDEALQLSAAEREALAARLFDSLEADDPHAELAWQMEIERRVADLDQGKVKVLTWTEARRRIFGDLNDRSPD
jgi:putative addiction module component (TIGR02574 family)